jgi:hypothetical protein
MLNAAVMARPGTGQRFEASMITGLDEPVCRFYDSPAFRFAYALAAVRAWWRYAVAGRLLAQRLGQAGT